MPPYLTQPLRRLSQQRGNQKATGNQGRARDWNTTCNAVAQFAGALRGIGLNVGDRVALLARNGDYYLDYVFGTVWAGGVFNPVNTRWTPAEIAYSLKDCATEILIVHCDFAAHIPALRKLVPGLRTIVQIDGTPGPDIIAYHDWLAAAEPVEDQLRCGSDLAAILYTGGTTGQPKGVMLSHENLVTSALSYISFPGARPGARYLHTAPLFHVGALSGMFASMLAGSTQIFIDAFEPGRVLETLEREHVTDVFLVPTMMRALLDDPAFDPARVGRVERIIYGASAIDDSLMDDMLDAFPQVNFVQAYGMTELSPIATMLGPDDHSAEARADGRGRSAGRATASTEIRIVDTDDVELPRGKTGEILVRGAGTMLGYWGMPDVTAETLRGGWMHTGDVGRMDANGYVTVVDRLKDMIITGGENVYSAEVENILTTHPDVVQAAVFGLPDDRWGETVHAVVVARAGSDWDSSALRQYCRQLIAGYKIPKSIEFVESLPLSPAGKVLKNELRARASAELSIAGHES